MPKTNVVVKLVGEDGNAYAIIGRVTKALRAAGYSQTEIKQYHKEAMSGDYDNLLVVTSEWVEIE